jgi:hypothetical protein
VRLISKIYYSTACPRLQDNSWLLSADDLNGNKKDFRNPEICAILPFGCPGRMTGLSKKLQKYRFGNMREVLFSEEKPGAREEKTGIFW